MINDDFYYENGTVVYSNGNVKVPVNDNYVLKVEKVNAQETADALEIVRLLEEMGENNCRLSMPGRWEVYNYVYGNYVNYEDLSLKSIIQCLRDAKAKGWKP